MANYNERMQAALGQRRSNAAARQRFLDLIYAQEEARMREAEQGAADAERAKKLNWFDDAAKGAQMGSALGPWGALAGGIVGTVKGQMESTKERGGGFGNYLKTAMDTPFGFNTATMSKKDSYGSLGGGTMEDLIGAGGTAASVYQRDKARTSTSGGQPSSYSSYSGPSSLDELDRRIALREPQLGESLYSDPNRRRTGFSTY